MSKTLKRTLVSLAILAALIPTGIAIRYAHLPLPWFLWKYMGSMLWAAAVYWLIAALLPRSKTHVIAALASLVAILTELSRLVPEPHIDAFRGTLAGKLLLGRYFAWANIAAYLAAIAVTAIIDARYETTSKDIHEGEPWLSKR
jgi:hypothetical protein